MYLGLLDFRAQSSHDWTEEQLMPKPHQPLFVCCRNQKSCCQNLHLDTEKHGEIEQYSRKGSGTSCQITLGKKKVCDNKSNVFG